MPIQFEFYKNPQPEKEGEEPSYHPRVVNFQHVTTQKLAAEIHMATTFGKSEVEAMLMELSRCMGNHLREGERECIWMESVIFKSRYRQPNLFIHLPPMQTK